MKIKVQKIKEKFINRKSIVYTPQALIGKLISQSRFFSLKLHLEFIS